MTHNIIIRHLVFPCIPGRGRRPRRPASPMASPLASPYARRAGDVAPYHNNMVGIMWHLVFPCIPGRGRRPRRPASRRRLRWRPRVRGAPGTSRPTIITWLASYGTLCSRVPGRGRRPRRPASRWRLRWRLRWRPRWRLRWRPRWRPRWRLRWRPCVCGAPGTSRPTRITCRRGGHLVFPRTRIRVFNGDHA